MPSRTTRQPTSRATLLRNVGFVIAVALGAVGIWLVVTGGNSTQRVEIGVLTGLWGLLLGAICGRRAVLPDPGAAPSRFPAPQPADAMPADATPADAVPVGARPERGPADAGQVAVRGAAPVDRLADAEARMAFEAELQKMLRQEVGSAVTTAVNTAVTTVVDTAVTTAVNTAVTTAVENAVGREIGALRAEIAQLRQELVDKVGGQLRLERIETTRLIGSDLEAMRAEVRRLKLASDPAAFDLDAAVLADAQLVEDGAAEVHEIADPQPTPAAVATPVNGAHATTETRRIPRVLPDEPEPAARPSGGAADDPFASLPRLTPFTEFPLDAVEAAADESGDAGNVGDSVSDTASDTAESRYAGRRRHGGSDDEFATTESQGSSEDAAGRRHHRADDGGNDLLARLLAREGVRR